MSSTIIVASGEMLSGVSLDAAMDADVESRNLASSPILRFNAQRPQLFCQTSDSLLGLPSLNLGLLRLGYGGGGGFLWGRNWLTSGVKIAQHAISHT